MIFDWFESIEIVFIFLLVNFLRGRTTNMVDCSPVCEWNPNVTVVSIQCGIGNRKRQMYEFRMYIVFMFGSVRFVFNYHRVWFNVTMRDRKSVWNLRYYFSTIFLNFRVMKKFTENFRKRWKIECMNLKNL